MHDTLWEVCVELVLLQELFCIWMYCENFMFSVEVKEEVLEYLFPPKLQSAVVEVVKNSYQESCFVQKSACSFHNYGYELVHVNVSAELP